MNLGRLIGFLVMAVGTNLLAQSAPPNDHFTNRAVLSGSSLTFTGTLVGATVEPTEPYGILDVLEPSVWWTWTAPASGACVLQIQRDFSSSPFCVAALTVYTGTNLNTLTPLSGCMLQAPQGRYCMFPVTAGTSYQFQVAGRITCPGEFTDPVFGIKLTLASKPFFIAQPQDCAVSPYGSALFSCFASSMDQPYFVSRANTYQWAFNGVPLPGEIFPSLVVHHVTTNQAGVYSVTASNSFGISESVSAVLSVIDTNSRPTLAALRSAEPTNFSFTLGVEPGRWYKVESSTNLQNWLAPIWLQRTNELNLVSIPRLGPVHFVRTSLDTPTDVCVAQLKRMREAFNLAYIEWNRFGWDGLTFDFLPGYLPIDYRGGFPYCPDGGQYGYGATVTNNPYCTIHRGHTLDGQ